MAHRKKFMGLGDPNITAGFQRICGINIRRNAGAKSVSQHAANGTVLNGYTDHCVTGKSSSTSGVDNGSVTSVTSLPNGCDSLFKSAGKNGHHNDIRKRILLNSDKYSVGDESLNHKLHVENGHKNGVGNGSESKKPNGICLHSTTSTHSIRDTNIIANGHSNQSMAEDDPCTESDYSIDNYLIYYIMTFGASLGNEVFYILFFSCSLWNFDSYVVRKVLICWCIVMYVGQAAKDVIRWPRPDSPPVVRLEKRYELEYGMPSTHAMVGVVIPFGMLYFMQGRYEFNLLLGTLFSVNWSILVSVSRLYLGMHSALDIIAGLLFAFLLTFMTIPFVDYIDTFLISHPYAVPCLIAVGISLCLLYPSLDKWSTARGDTTLSIAVFSGIFAGLWLTRKQTDFIPEADTAPYLLQFPDSNVIWMSLIRETLGVFLVVILMTVAKFVFLHISCKIFGFDPNNQESKKHLVIELPYKYVSYFIVSAFATYVMPLLFVHFNIQRPNFYSEMFIYP